MLQRKYGKLWTGCQKCQGSLTSDIICSNRDCPKFYQRKKVQNELGEIDAILKRFKEDW